MSGDGWMGIGYWVLGIGYQVLVTRPDLRLQDLLGNRERITKLLEYR